MLVGGDKPAEAEPQAGCFGFSDPDVDAKHSIRIKLAPR